MSKINPLTKNLNTFQNCTLTHNNEDFDTRTMEIEAVDERKGMFLNLFLSNPTLPSLIHFYKTFHIVKYFVNQTFLTRDISQFYLEKYDFLTLICAAGKSRFSLRNVLKYFV